MAIAEQLNNLTNDLVTIHNEVGYQDELIASIITALSNKTAGGTASAGFIYDASKVELIASYAFCDSDQLIGIDIPSCNIIEDYAFKGCSNLKDAFISPQTISIGEGAFQSCTSLGSISLPSSLSSIGENAFYNCTALSEISYNGTVSDFESLMTMMGASNPGTIYFTGVPAEYIVCKDGNIYLFNSES